MSSHLLEMAIVGTNALLAHVTWRTLPDEHRHSVRRAARAARERAAGLVRRRSTAEIIPAPVV